MRRRSTLARRKNIHILLYPSRSLDDLMNLICDTAVATFYYGLPISFHFFMISFHFTTYIVSAKKTVARHIAKAQEKMQYRSS